MRHSWVCGAAICCALWCCGASVLAQDEAEEEPYLPGLIAEFQQTNSPPVVRLEAVVAGNWTDRPDERLRAGEPFTVTYRGVLDVPDDGSYQLHVHGSGDVHISLNGKSILSQKMLNGWASSSAQQLTFGPLPLEVKFAEGEGPAKIALFWSSDRFEREPIPARMLKHEREKVVSTEFEQGRVLARALRCEACHDEQQLRVKHVPAPALDRLAGNLQRDWLVNWLKSSPPKEEANSIERRMPHFALPAADAELLADWLLSASDDSKESPKPEKPAKRDPKKPEPSREAGEQLLLTRGCLACHRVGEFGESGLFGGGDLTAIAAKRPAGYFAKWLQDPGQLNQDHRMPVFDLTADERTSLALALQARGEPKKSAAKAFDEFRARDLASQLRCNECHRVPEAKQPLAVSPVRVLDDLTSRSNWKQSCAVAEITPRNAQPQFHLPKASAAALKVYFSQRVAGDPKVPVQTTGEQLLIENNCLACHAREPQPAGVLPTKFGDKLVKLAEANEDLAPQVPALTPPSLNSVGDKLTDAALAGAITRAGPAHRPYLQVQMPKFRLSKEQTTELAQHFIDLDRIPDYERTVPNPTPAQLAARRLAGKRLVGTDGFSCTACHQVGSVQPVKAPPNARGPTLSMPQDRLRKTWFDRWVRNPARIIPRMEMPSVQTPVRGVLQDNLHDQLAAVWQVLSTPGFEPPLPEPVRTLRFYSSEDNSQKQPLVVTDLIEYDGQTLERAALIGLPNRQNLLFDFATNRLLSWSQGDLARQRTKGKNWYWEPAGSPLLTPGIKQSEFAFEVAGQMWEPTTEGQWLAELRNWNLTMVGAKLDYKIRFQPAKAKPGEVHSEDVFVQQTFESRSNSENGFDRRIELGPVPRGAKVHWRLLDADKQEIAPAAVKITADELLVSLPQRGAIRISVNGSPVKFAWLPEGTAVIEQTAAGGMSLTMRYTSTLPRDEFHAPRPPAFPFTQPPVTIAPGFTGQRLSLATDIMPTALAWRPNGDLIVASLKGQVLSFTADSVESPQPQGMLLADGLAAPYGVQAGPDYVDVITKSALVRLIQHRELPINEFLVLAAGWGYTSDYHDWAVGLPKDEAGNYYLALPCFQDNRSEAAKRWRGSVLKLTPRKPTSHEPHLFDLHVLTHGHRFPMGMALNKDGELFVTDNQGNYNPFNELNHVVPGKHFGFVNKGQEKPEKLTPPTIDVPHPWTRSVNGICFLNTPRQLSDNLRDKQNHFGPLEGHLVGCEYDTRRLIRMSLQKVNGEYQGCAYPLTIPTPPEEAPLGPLCCEVAPSGELYIGSIRDSGWGAANNIGEVIRVKVDPAKFGHGLAEMRAIAGGFELDFFSPVERELAENIENYSLSSYRRESTPAYGGNDIDRRTEKVASVTLSEDRRRVTLKLDSLRAGHAYELRLKSLAPAGELFFPAEAHYTLRQLVK